MSKFNYVDAMNWRQTAQSEPAPGKAQVENYAGGYVFELDCWGRLDRFLILGSDSPTYYAGARKLTKKNAEAVMECLKADGPRTVNRIVEVSASFRAPKNDPALFALAMAATPQFAEWQTRGLALKNLGAVARTGTHLFQFAGYVDSLRGWGRSLRTAVGAWYNEKDPGKLAYQLVKYQQREGWSHRDVLRMAHPKPATTAHDELFAWSVKGDLPEHPTGPFADSVVAGYELAKRAKTEDRIAKLVHEYGLTWEMVPTEWRKSAVMWEALLEKMPMTAMIRNLANMTRCGLLAPMSDAVQTVCSRLDSEAVKKAGVHPLQVLVALKAYSGGRGVARSKAVGYHSRGYVSAENVNTWDPVTKIVDALDAAFYQAFGNVEPTNKATMLALDVSGSMAGPELSGMTGITPRVGSAAMALITARVEPQHVFTMFSSGGSNYSGKSRSMWERGISTLDLSPRMRLDDAIRKVSGLPFGGTDCSLPMLYALEQGLKIESFIVYTDNETWAGRIHPFQALRDYRNKTGLNAKLVVVGMTTTEFTIADPSDPGMLDVVGFSTAAPGLIRDFCAE